jgi:hypothetical protein
MNPTSRFSPPDLIVDANNSPLCLLRLNQDALFEQLPDLDKAVKNYALYLKHDKLWEKIAGQASETQREAVADHYLAHSRLHQVSGFPPLSALLQASGLVQPPLGPPEDAEPEVVFEAISLELLLGASELRSHVPDAETRPRALDEIVLKPESWKVVSSPPRPSSSAIAVSPVTLRVLCAALEGVMFLSPHSAPRSSTVFVRLGSPLYLALHAQLSAEKPAHMNVRLFVHSDQLYAGFHWRLVAQAVRDLIQKLREISEVTHGKVYL